MITDLLLCEFHDARVESLQFIFPDRLVVHFKETNCFYKTNETGIADVWICRTTLSFSGVEEVDMSLPVSIDMYVSDAEFTFKVSSSSDKYNLVLLQGKDCVSSKLIFTSGGIVDVTGGFVQLEINNRIRFLEKFDWAE